MGSACKVHAKTQNDKSFNSSSQSRNNGCCRSANSPTEKITFLQRTAGNQAVQRLIKSGVLQAKLKIGQPNDIYEQEADRVAEQVMRMPDPVLQRKCTKCNKEEDTVLKAKKSPGQVPMTQEQNVPPIVQEDVLRSPGQALDSETRAFMEPRFGYDFSGVRVHTDKKAMESARAVNALAYTIGQDVVLGTGQYSPNASEGQKLLAHELAHIVQQTQSMRTNQLSSISGLIQRRVVCDEWGVNCQSVPDENQESSQSIINQEQITDQSKGLSAIDIIHGALAILGFCPGIGIITDGIDAGIYALEGDWANAGLSAVAMVPLWGDGVKVGTIAGKSAIKISEKAAIRLGEEGIAKGLREVKAASKVEKSAVETAGEAAKVEKGAVKAEKEAAESATRTEKKAAEKEAKGKSKEKKKGGKYTCYGWSAVLQIPSALPEFKCPLDGQYVPGPSVSASSEDAACRAAKHAFNAMIPRGCKPKHLDCRCSKR